MKTLLLFPVNFIDVCKLLSSTKQEMQSAIRERSKPYDYFHGHRRTKKKLSVKILAEAKHFFARLALSHACDLKDMILIRETC